MKINDLIEPFVKNYKASPDYLYEYYSKYEKYYMEYFKYHCLNVEEKKKKALVLHPKKIQDLLAMRDIFFEMIPKITAMYESILPIKFTEDVHLLVGLYGSNAFTFRQYNPEVAFCLEKLPYNKKYIQIIVAHEFGHVTQHLYTAASENAWEKVNWFHPYTWLLQEGIATFLSTIIVKADLDEYFAFEEDKDWINFAQENESKIIQRFLEDLDSGIENNQFFKEWFSINGGHHFKLMRLGYYLGYRVVLNLVKQFGIENVLTIWVKEEFDKIMEGQLRKLVRKDL